MPTYQRSAIHTISDIIAVADHAGSFFFSPGARKAFSSRTLTGIHAPDGHESLPGRRYVFVTSERYGDEPRHYRVRLMTLDTVRDDRPSVSIDSGEAKYATAAQARRAAKTIAERITANPCPGNHESLSELFACGDCSELLA